MVAPNFWCKGNDLIDLKKQCRSQGSWKKGEKRVFHVMLVHKDSYIDGMGNIVMPNELATETAIDLGKTT